MRRDPVTKEDIKHAIAELVASGAVPTCRSVRDLLGGGSMTTISRLMREFEREEVAPAAVAISLTPDQIARVGHAIEVLLGELRAEDLLEIERVKSAADVRIADAERRADDLAEAVDAEYQACEERLKRAAEESEELRHRVAMSMAERDAAQTNLAEERALRSRSEGTLSQMHEEHGRLQARIEMLVAEVAALGQRLDGATTLLDERRQQLERLGAHAEELQQALAGERLARARAEDKAEQLTKAESALLAKAEALGRLWTELDRAFKGRTQSNQS